MVEVERELFALAVHLEFLQQADRGLRSTPLPLAPDPILRVEDRDAPQRFEIRLPEAALRELERARSDPPPRAKNTQRR